MQFEITGAIATIALAIIWATAVIVSLIIWTIGVTAVTIWLIAEPRAVAKPLKASMIAGNVPKIDVQAFPNAVIAGAALPRAVPIASTNGESLASPGAASPTALMTIPNAVPNASTIDPAALPIDSTTVPNAEPIEPIICETPLAWLASSENEATINAIAAPIPTAAIAIPVANESI